MSGIREACGEEGDGLRDLGMPGNRAVGAGAASVGRSTGIVGDHEYEVVCILVLVAVLEREDLQDRLGEQPGDANGHRGAAAIVESISFDDVFDVVPLGELGATDVERADT